MKVRNGVMAGALTAALLVAAGPASAATLDPTGTDEVGNGLSVEREEAAADDLAAVAAAEVPMDAVLTPGETLAPGQALVSASGRYATVLTEEGELLLVLQPTRFNPDPVILFDLALGDPGASLTLQGDGNLVMYNPDGSVAENFGTNGSGADQLVMQDDRNLVLYAGSGVVINFDTRTMQFLVPGQALLSGDQLVAEDGSNLVMQTDGNLVLYKDGRVQFQSGTRSEANNGADAVLQTDGNFVVYAGDRPVFNTGTSTSQVRGENRLLILDIGEFSVLDFAGDRVESVYGSAWTSNVVLPGQSLLPGDRRQSADRRSLFIVQTDSNVVQYRDGRATFQTGSRGADVAVMQTDGNFVVYAPDFQGGLSVLFQTRTDGNPGASLVLPDGGGAFQVRTSGGRVVFPR